MSDIEELPPQVQHQLIRLQETQQKLELLVVQRTQLEQLMKETEHALAELADLEADAAVYQFIGPLLIKAERDKVKEELEDKKVTLEMRIQTLQRQEEKTRGSIKDLQTKLQASLQRRGQGTAG